MNKLFASGVGQAHIAITASDSTTYGQVSAGDTYNRPDYLYIGGAGTIAITSKNGVSVTYTVPAGTILPFSPYKILSTGTTATGIVGIYAQ